MISREINRISGKKTRISRILEKYCFSDRGEFLKPVKDKYGDTVSLEKYAERPVYFSNYLHRYNPYAGLTPTRLAIKIGNLKPMAILPLDEPDEICTGDVLRVCNKEYTVSHCENVRNRYCLISLTERGGANG